MAHYKLETTLLDLRKSIDGMEHLANAARQWVSVTMPRGVPGFTVAYIEIITEMAFLRCFGAWEAFLEESFLLYLQGKSAPSGKMPKSYVLRATRTVAEQIVLPDGKKYAGWANAQHVMDRAERFFKGGEPYSGALRSQQAKLQRIETIRNAVAHSSTYSLGNFKNLVRQELTTYPPNLTVGGFLAMTKPGSSPPISFLEYYCEVIRYIAGRIVPV
jgi:hypothetical protein